MGDDILKTGSSLSEIINKQHKANISCEESQTVFDYYVSTLQANFKSPLVAESVDKVNDSSPKDPLDQEDLFPIIEEVGKEFQHTDLGNGQDILTSLTLPLADVSRKRPRYQSPLETIDECDIHIQEHEGGVNVRREPEQKFKTTTSNSRKVSNSTVTTRQNGGKRSRLPKERRRLKTNVQMLYQTEVWTQEDENDRVCVENKLLLKEDNELGKVSSKKYDVLEPTRLTNSFRETHQSFVKSPKLTSKISSIEGKPTESCTADQSEGSSYITNAEDDGAFSVMPKLSVVDIQRYHVRSQSQRVKVNSAVPPDMSALQEPQSFKADFPSEDNEFSDSIFHQVEKDMEMSSERGTLQQNTRRQDADKHIEMVREKQERAKELFSKLNAINDIKVQNISCNSSLVLEASIKKCTLLSRSSSCEPEEVISATTIMLDELTNLISTTTNQIRQVAKGINTEGENLNLEPFLSGPRSISSLFSSTETIMSPVRMCSSSFETDSGANLFMKEAMGEGVSPDKVTTNKNEATYSENKHKPPNLKSNIEKDLSSDGEYDIVKSGDLISFVDDQNVMTHSYQQLNASRPPSTNIMDAELEELPGWQNNKNLTGAEELAKKWEGDESRTSKNASSMKKSTINNSTVEDFKKGSVNSTDLIPVHSTSCTSNATPVTRRLKNQNRNVIRTERDASSTQVRTAPGSFSQTITQPNKNHSSGHNRNIQQEKYGNKHRNLLTTTGMQTKEFRKTSPRRETHFSDSRTVDKNQRPGPNSVHEQRIKNKESYGESGLRSPSKNQQNQLPRQPTVQTRNEQKRKSNTLTLKSKETRHALTSSTVKDMKTNKLAKQVQLENKTLERNLSSICDKISVLKSCVADSNTCSERSVRVERCVVETSVGDKLPFVSKLSSQQNVNNKGHTNRTEGNITEKSLKPDTFSNANSNYVSEIQHEKPDSDNNKGVFRNTQTIRYPNRLNPPGSHPGVPKETSRRTNVLSSNYLGDAHRSKYDSTHTPHRDSDGNKRPTSVNIKPTQTTTKGGLSSSQKRSVSVEKGNRHPYLQTKHETHSVRVLPDSKRHAERPKRLLTHQEIQEWVNINQRHHRHHRHDQRCCNHSTKHRKQSASPYRKKSCPFSEGTKSAREIPHRVQSASPSSRSRRQSPRSSRTKRSSERDHTSDTSLSDLISIHSSPCIERTASQLFMDSLTDTVEFSLSQCLSSKSGANLEKKFRHLCENRAQEIVNKIGSCDDDSTNSSSIHSTINHLVKSLDNTIHARSDKRVCWDSSTDTPPRCKSATEKTHLEIVETGSRVLETITNKLIRKLSVKANKAGCKDDPETEVSYNSKRIGDSFSSPSSLYESDPDSATPEESGTQHKASASGSRMPDVTHQDNLNTLLDVLKSTSDGNFRNRCNRKNENIPSGVAEATHAMAALEDLQALLSSLKNDMNNQRRSRTPYSPVSPSMAPLPPISNRTESTHQELGSVSKDPQPTIETRGDTTIIMTSRAPVKRPPQPPKRQPVLNRQPSSLFTKYSPRTVSSNTSTVRTSTNSTRSFTTSVSFDRSTIPNSQAPQFKRPQSVSAPCRSGNSLPQLHTHKSTHGDISTPGSRASQSSPPRRNQSHGCWLNQNAGVLPPTQTPNSSTKDRIHSVSDNASVRSSSSCCTRRVYELSQPKKRHLEATKTQYQNILRQPFIERLDRRIRSAEVQTSPTPHKEMKTKCPARKRPTTMAERVDRKVARMMKYCPEDDTKEKKTPESGKDSVQETIKTATSSEESEIADSLSTHNNSPSDESQEAAIDDRDYFHYSDTSVYATSALNTVEFGGFVYVGAEKKPTLTTSEELVDINVTMHEVNQNNNCINIDLDTWNIIAQSCIENFQQEDPTLIFQTSIISPPKLSEVTISEITDSQEDLLNQSMVQEKYDNHFEVSDLEDKKGVKVLSTTQLQSHTDPEIISSVPSTLIKDTCPVNLGLDLCSGCDNEPLVKCDDPTLQTSKLAIVDENVLSPNEQNLSTTATGKESVENIIFEVMEGIANEGTEVSTVGPPGSDTGRQSTYNCDESVVTDSESSYDGVTVDSDEPNHVTRRKTYHPKQSIPDEIAIALQENYDAEIFFDIVKQYLSSESETESNSGMSKTAELKDKQLEPRKGIVVDLCGLYEPFSEDSSSEETSYISAHQSVSIYTSFSESSSANILEPFPLDFNNVDTETDRVVTNTSHQTKNTLHNNENVELQAFEGESDMPTVEEHHIMETLLENVSEVTEGGTDHHTRQQKEYNIEHENESQNSSLTTFTAGSQTLNETSSHTTWMDEYHNGSENTSESKFSIDQNFSLSLSQTKFPSLTQNDGQKEAQANCVVEDQIISQNKSNSHDSITEDTVKHIISEGQLMETVQEPSSSTKHARVEQQQSTCNLTLETILPPNSCLVPSVTNSATWSVPSLSYHSTAVSDVSSEVFPPHSATRVILPVLDITTAGTVRDLLGALTHVASGTGTTIEDMEAFDTTVLPRSMETLLKQFSAVSIPGVVEQRDDVPREDTLDSILESLALLPAATYYGLYSTSTTPLATNRATIIEHLAACSPLDLETIRSDRNVQTDDADINWPTLSTSEILDGGVECCSSTVPSSGGAVFGSKAESDPGLGNRSQDDLDDELETCISVSSPGLLFNVETEDLPYVGEAESRSLIDLAIYTDILVSYSSRERIAELMTSLGANAPPDDVTMTSPDDVEPLETHRKVVIMSIAYFVVSFIMFGIFTIPKLRCE